MKKDKRNSLPALEVRCDVCGGTGCDEGKCSRCNGSGYAPTEDGQKIVELMRHQLSAIFERILDGTI
jgi:DnaJ-class molecular chaperone